MKKLTIHNPKLLLLAMPFLMSCERAMVLDAEEKPQVVVDYVMTSDPAQTIRLSFSKGASKEMVEPVTEATVLLFDESGNKQAGAFQKAEDGVWTLDYEPESLHVYSITVDVPGYQTITARQQMPQRLDVRAFGKCVECEHHHKAGKGPVEYDVMTPTTEEMWIYAMNYDESSGKMTVADLICSDLENVRSERSGIVYDGGLYPELHGQELFRKVLKFNPRKQLHSNRRVGVFGFVCTISGNFNGNFPNQMDPSCHNNCNGRMVNNGQLLSPGEKDGYIVFALPSKEYCDYLDDVDKFVEIQQSTDMSIVYLRDNIYTNISGGIGFFGAVSLRRMVWSSDVAPEDDIVIGRKDF